MNTPIKRHISLQPLSRDHHQALLLCWKIKKGLAANIDPERIKKYVDWFYSEHIIPHFEAEEKFIFPILSEDHELIKQALEEHKRLKSYFEASSDLTTAFRNIETELEKHIRFEERVLFNEIQSSATAEQLQLFADAHKEGIFCENYEDEFWVTENGK